MEKGLCEKVNELVSDHSPNQGCISQVETTVCTSDVFNSVPQNHLSDNTFTEGCI